MTRPAFSPYDLGRTTIFALAADPRFQYCLYVPPSVADGARLDLVVAVHGTSRTSFLDFRDGLAEFGRWHGCAILCPLFPVGVLGDGARSGYKYIREGSLRYDAVLLDMVRETADKYRQDWDRFALFGFSGGGQFVHRFALLHPTRLWALSVGSPGSVTLLDPDRDWWVGVRNVAELFGVEFDPAALAAVPVHMAVGDADLETWELVHKPGGPHWMEGANDAGATRPQRLAALRQSFESRGISVRFDLLPGAAHDRFRVLESAKEFLAGALSARRAGGQACSQAPAAADRETA